MTQENAESTSAQSNSENSVKLNGLFAFKVGMTQVFDDKGVVKPVTVLKYEPWVVTQIKTKDKDGYEGVQIACRPRTEKRSSAAQIGGLKSAGFKAGAYFVREIRQSVSDIKVGATVDLATIAKGDVIKVTSRSKGKGFAGVMKRWNAGGGPGAHGSTFHRQPGSSGNRTWPGRIMKGKHYPGHLGDENVTVKNLEIVDVYPEESVILVCGAVPGSRNSLVRLTKA